MKETLDIIVDFDGSCVTHEYPRVGCEIGAVPVLRDLVKAGHRLILSTMRSNKPFLKWDGTIDSSGLDDAVDWFKQNQIQLYGIQTNPSQKSWTDSPKAYGQLHIDDAALGCPMIYPENPKRRGYVNWKIVRRMLEEKGLLLPKEKYNLFLDDERIPLDVFNMSDKNETLETMYTKWKWVVVRSYDEFVRHINQNGIPEWISFDHDLGDIHPDRPEKTGMDCAKWLVDMCIDQQYHVPSHVVHSQNTVGGPNIKLYLENFENKREW